MAQGPHDADTAAVAVRAFLGALDDERWLDAAAWLHPESAAVFRLQQIELVRLAEGRPNASTPSDTHFPRPDELLRVESAAEAEALSAAEIFARFAAAVGPGAHPDGEGPLRLRRTLQDLLDSAAGVTARYRTEVYRGDTPLPHLPFWNDLRELHLERTAQGWRVRDVDLGVTDGRGLLLSDELMALLRGEEGRSA